MVRQPAPRSSGEIVGLASAIQRTHRRGMGAWRKAYRWVLNIAEREQLATIVADCSRPRNHIERARIVLALADRHWAHIGWRKALASADRRCVSGNTVCRKGD